MDPLTYWSGRALAAISDLLTGWGIDPFGALVVLVIAAVICHWLAQY